MTGNTVRKNNPGTRYRNDFRDGRRAGSIKKSLRIPVPDTVPGFLFRSLRCGTFTDLFRIHASERIPEKKGGFPRSLRGF
jgi:hypothetical protein